MGQFDHVVVVGYGRSAVAKSGKKGALRNMHPVTMGGLTLKGVLERVPQLPADQIDDLIVGCAIPERKQGFNMARLVAARAGLPDSVCGMTINRFCSSGLQAIALAAGQIACGVADVMVAGGVESMTACPVNLDISDTFDPDLLRQREEEYMPMGLTAENVASRYGITRQEMDELALQSHRRAAAAQDGGKFDDEIIPLPGVDVDGNPIVFDKDQGIRRSTTLEALAGLKPCFKEGGLVTAATSSQTSDAAAFVVLMRDSKAKELGIRPVAELLSFAVVGCEPDYMGLGPIYAAPKALEKAGYGKIPVLSLNFSGLEKDSSMPMDLTYVGKAYYGMTQEDAAAKLGKAQSTIANKLRLLRLTADEREVIMKYNLTERHARALLRLAAPAERLAGLERVVKQNLNVEKTEAAVEEVDRKSVV